MKSVVLLSSGLDSTVNFLVARRESEVVQALTFDYGQKAAAREIEHAAALCRQYGVPHKVVELPFFKDFTRTSLVSATAEIPVNMDIHSHQDSMKSAEKVWVPNRNGIFLNIAAGYAEGLNAEWVVPGFNAEEAATFADNSRDFQEILDESFHFSTRNRVKVRCFTLDMNKTEILQWGLELGMNLELLWPCYHGGEEWCGECESCRRFENARKQGSAL